MIKVRKNVFETNSSSTHSITMCMKDEYDDWENGKVFLNNFWENSSSLYKDKTFVTKDEAIDILQKSKFYNFINYNDNENEILSIFKDANIISFDMFCNEDTCLEDFYEEYVTPSGETIVAFGEYGYDG